MGLVIKSYPSDTSSVSNEMLFVIDESVKAHDEVTYPNYRYVLDIYVNSVLVARMKATPDPTYGFGIFDVSEILKNYAPDYGLMANYASQTENYDVKLSYQCKLGEEYSDTLYTNLVTDSARTTFRTYVIKPRLTTNPISDKMGLLASNIPDITSGHISGYKEDKWFIIPFIDNVSGTTISYNFDDGNGNIIGSAGTVNYTGAMINKILQINLGFIKLAALLGLTSQQQANVKRLNFDLDNNVIYILDYICTKYPVITLAWLNPYGAYESYSFGFVSKKSKEISRKEFSQKNYQIDASGVVSYDSNGVMYGSKRGFNTLTKITMKLTSHLLNQHEYNWLADLFSSPDVYMYDSVIDRYVPVTIKETTYEHKNYLNSGIPPIEFNIEFSDEFNSQLL